MYSGQSKTEDLYNIISKVSCSGCSGSQTPNCSINKTVKRLEKKKMNSKVKWQERVKAEHKRQEARQKTTKQNIREREWTRSKPRKFASKQRREEIATIIG